VYFIIHKSVAALIALTLLAAVVPARAQADEQLVDSLLTVLDDAKGQEKFSAEFELFRLHLQAHDSEEANRYAQQSLQTAIQLKDTLSLVKAYNALGYIKKELGYPRIAIPNFESALKLARQKNYKDQIKYILNNLGQAHVLSANYAKALDIHLESLKIREEEHDTVSISVALNNIGVFYQHLGDYENALTYYKTNYSLKVKAKEYSDFDLCIINIADACNALGRYDEARDYLKEVFEYCQKNKDCDKRELALAHNAMGYSYLNTSDLVHAEQEFFIAVNLNSEIKSQDRIDNYHALALVRYRMGDFSGALDKLDIAQTLATETEIPKFQLKNYQLYSDIYSKQKDYKKASEYQRKFIALNEEIYNADLIKNIARIQSQHQEEEHLRTIAAQDQEILSREESIKIQSRQVFSMGVIVFLVSVLALGVLIVRRHQVKKNLQLNEARKTIEEKNQELMATNENLDRLVEARTKELDDANKSLEKVNEELDNFLYKTSHDIRGPLASLKGLTNLALREANDEMVASYLLKLDLTADKLNKVLTRLQIVSQISNAVLVPDIIDIKFLIDDILDVERRRGLPARMKIQTIIDDTLVLISDKTILKLILENLIENAIKFHNSSGRVEPYVKITVQNEENGVTIKVLDNGIGIKSIKVDDVFKMFVRASERSEAGGIGLYLTKISTEKLFGNIKLNTTIEEFTEFIVSLPSDLRAVAGQREASKRDLAAEKEKRQLMAQGKQNPLQPA